MGTMNFFASVSHLRPRCPNCQIELEYGENTKYQDEHDTHVCLGCGHVLKESLDKEFKMSNIPDDEP